MPIMQAALGIAAIDPHESSIVIGKAENGSTLIHSKHQIHLGMVLKLPSKSKAETLELSSGLVKQIGMVRKVILLFEH